MAGEIVIRGSNLGTVLSSLLMADEIQPGSDASYQLCKEIYLYHPLGAKMAEAPISMAQSQERLLTVADSPEDDVREQFLRVWRELGCDAHIYSAATLARVYGVSTVLVGIEGADPTKPLPTESLANAKIFFNVLDPLNTSGSFSIMQDPNLPLAQIMDQSVSVAGVRYHPSRTCVLMNELPVYLSYTTSGYGYVGRSVYQRPLYALKSFIQSMKTDDLVTRKAGLLVAMMKQPGAIIDNIMANVMGVKRQLLRSAMTDDVISIGEGEEIKAVDLTNVDGAHENARKHILENAASSASMPAILLNSETFAQGLSEGNEDAKTVARYVDRERIKLGGVYKFFDNITQRCAWTEEFYATIQEKYPEYRKVKFKDAYFDWVKNFSAAWPSLLTEPDSEKIKVEDIKLKAIIGLLEAMTPNLDPEGIGNMLDWAQQNINENKLLFPHELVLDIPAIQAFLEEQKAQVEEQQQAEQDALAEPKPPTDKI